MTAVLGVDSVSIALLDDDGRTLTLSAVRGLGEEDVGRVQIPAGRGFVGRIAASRAPQIADADALSAEDFEGAPPILRERLRSLAGVPLLVEDHVAGREAAGQPATRLVGVLIVGGVAPHCFSKVDVQLLQLVGDRIALAVDRARLYAAEQDARRRAEAEAARARAGEEQATERAESCTPSWRPPPTGWPSRTRMAASSRANRAFRELLAVDRAAGGFDTLSFVDRAPLLDMRDPATGEPLPSSGIPSRGRCAGRWSRGRKRTSACGRSTAASWR